MLEAIFEVVVGHEYGITMVKMQIVYERTTLMQKHHRPFNIHRKVYMVMLRKELLKSLLVME
jgi:hypothetical protein